MVQSAFNSEDNHVVPLLPEPTIHPTDLGARRHGCNATLARNLASRVHSSNVIGLQIRYFQPPMRASVVIPCYRPDANFEKMLGDLNAQTCQTSTWCWRTTATPPFGRPCEGHVEAAAPRHSV